MSLLGKFTASTSQFANKRGFYLGRHSTKVHVALYRRTGGRIGGHLPGWPEARIVLVDHAGAKSGRSLSFEVGELMLLAVFKQMLALGWHPLPSSASTAAASTAWRCAIASA